MAGWTSDEKLCDFLDWWTTEYLPRRVANGRLAEETMDGYETSVRLHITPRLGDVGLTDLTATLLEDWLDDLADAGLGPRGRQKALRTLSVALSVALRRDLIGRNPARNVEGPRVVAKRVKAWTRAQAGAFIAAAAGAPQLHGNLWLTQLGTGLRPSEVLALHVDDVDLGRARVRVHRNLSWRKGGRWVVKTTKGEDDVWLALPGFDVSAVRRHLEVRAEWAAWDGWQEHGLLFTARAGIPLRGTSIGKPLTRLCELAGVPRVTPHGIRHQTASALLAAGKSLTDVQYVLRHKTQRLTSDLYGHMADDARGHAAVVLDELSPDR
jgi:integrase